MEKSNRKAYEQTEIRRKVIGIIGILKSSKASAIGEITAEMLICGRKLPLTGLSVCQDIITQSAIPRNMIQLEFDIIEEIA